MRLRIKPAHVDDVLAMLADAKIAPSRVYDRDDGVIAIEIGEIPDAQAGEIVSAFRPEWSAIIGIAGGHPLLKGH
ncbi:hypothetical protein LPN01_05130 [Sphingomonas sp. A2-49]|uniref:hypothetical protein n=1 Tax=Sphingomonas sp. A2-49 TaxID=1391375 RepID=UPI0021CF20CB|nr:hypothetical protein [Sphingomonas sp. A2-49]MCU6453456.1 hypothetical protein [Sphingomonas sp. A2-49]